MLTGKFYKQKCMMQREYCLKNNKQITAASIKDFLSGKEENKRVILEVFAEHNKQELSL
jgi:hypothetical protein